MEQEGKDRQESRLLKMEGKLKFLPSLLFTCSLNLLAGCRRSYGLPFRTRKIDLTCSFASTLEKFCKEYLSPILEKAPQAKTWKLPLVFVSDETYNEWQPVFNAWEDREIIGEDGLKLGFSRKPACRDITLTDLQWMINLRDHECKRLAKEIMDLKVYMKVTGKELVQRYGISLHVWCEQNKMDYIIKNELMLIYKGYPLRKPGDSKYLEWSLDEWESLQVEKEFNDTMISNIQAEVYDSEVGKEWLAGPFMA